MKHEAPNSKYETNHKFKARNTKCFGFRFLNLFSASDLEFRVSNKGGFTLIELMVSIAIFALMTGLVVAKYGNFNQSVLLTDLAYDVALTVRTAQTYGLSVTGAAEGVSSFQYAYGVNFETGANANRLVLYASPNTGDTVYTGTGEGTDLSSGDVAVNKYNIKRGAVISRMCASNGSDCTPSDTVLSLNIAFRRPDPNALICINDGSGNVCQKTFAKIELRATDGNTRVVSIRDNGQISVGN